jgi:predicted MPP superfamily phosphohydrolase
MITRRQLLVLPAVGLATAAYGLVIEPDFLLRVVNYKITPPNWTPGLKLKVVLLADPHVVEPYMPLSRWQKIIANANELEPDLILMLGDYVSGIRFRTGTVPVTQTAKAAAAAKARLGVFSINGNHDWWGDRRAERTHKGPPESQLAFEDAGIEVLSNKAVRLTKVGLPFWVSGTDSILAYWLGPNRFQGMDDLEGTLAQVTDNAPIIHMAHEPDLFVKIPDRVSITLSGHTHGGQLRIMGYSPVVPSSYGNRFAYGHIVENGRHLVVSGGLGVSTIPMRLGVPPEITVLDLG